MFSTNTVSPRYFGHRLPIFGRIFDKSVLALLPVDVLLVIDRVLGPNVVMLHRPSNGCMHANRLELLVLLIITLDELFRLHIEAGHFVEILPLNLLLHDSLNVSVGLSLLHTLHLEAVLDLLSYLHCAILVEQVIIVGRLGSLSFAPLHLELVGLSGRLPKTSIVALSLPG